jgi:hypothetical protein
MARPILVHDLAFCPSASHQLMVHPPQTWTMLAADHILADEFDLGADPESVAFTPGEVGQLCNTEGYLPSSWMEDRSQSHCVHGIMGALIGHTHPTLTDYDSFLHQYNRMIVHLESEINAVHGRRQ